jgi:hypothetical protein
MRKTVCIVANCLVGLSLALLSIGTAWSQEAATRQELLDKLKQSRQGGKVRTVPANELGISDDKQVAGVKGDFCNSWTGYVHGKLVVIVSGYEFENPLVGKLWIVEGSKTGHFAFFATPTSTGPACIIAEHNGTLLIKSQQGQYQQEREGDKTRSVVTPGNATYNFNLEKQEFEEKR